MKRSKESTEMRFIRARALEDLAKTSDEDLRKEFLESGEDIRVISAQVKEKLRDAAAGAMRHRVAAARERSILATQIQPTASKRPALDRIKKVLEEVFQREPEVAMAFRDGKKQSDRDLETVYDDLVRMGVIKSEENDD